MKTRTYNKKGSWKILDRETDKVLAIARTQQQAQRTLDSLKQNYDNLELVPDKSKISLQSLSKSNYFKITPKEQKSLSK